MSEQYRVVLNGYASTKGEYFVEVDFARLFKITPEKARELFQAAPVVIKERLPIEEASRYKDAIEKTGAACSVESMRYNFSGLSIQK